MKDVTGLGLGGRLLSVGVKVVSELSEKFSLRCEDISDDEEEDCQGPFEEQTNHHIQCGRCGHHIANSSQIINVETKHALSTGI